MQPTGKTAEQVRHYQTGRKAEENCPARRNTQLIIQHKPRHCTAKGLMIQIKQHGVLPQRNQPPQGLLQQHTRRPDAHTEPADRKIVHPCAHSFCKQTIRPDHSGRQQSPHHPQAAQGTKKRQRLCVLFGLFTREHAAQKEKRALLEITFHGPEPFGEKQLIARGQSYHQHQLCRPGCCRGQSFVQQPCREDKPEQRRQIPQMKTVGVLVAQHQPEIFRRLF